MTATPICLLLLYMASCEGLSSWRKYSYTKDPLIFDQICSADHVYFQTAARSDVSCVRKCSGTTGCTGVVYLHSNMTCYGTKGYNSFEAVTSPLPGAVLYKISAIPLTPTVADDQFTASSCFDERHMPWQARLNSGFHWSPLGAYTKKEWVQVEFQHQIVATAVITKGDSREDFHYFVESYKILTSADCSTPVIAIKNTEGEDMIFQGNVDRDTAVQNNLVPHVICRCFRVNPVTWWGKWAELRFEVMGHFY